MPNTVILVEKDSFTIGCAKNALKVTMIKPQGKREMSVKDYLLGIRLEHAVRELEETGGQIVDIALGNGFPNSKAFSNAFREKYGVLPSEYRKNNQ